MSAVYGPIRQIAAALAWILGIGLSAAIVALSRPDFGLAELVEAHLEESGVRHPVTAVLLNYRGYDTLLEIAVLLLAVLGILAFRPPGPASIPDAAPDSSPVLAALSRLIVPLIVLAAGYLLWAGAHRPGGAFQAGAVLAGGGVLLRLTGTIPSFESPNAWLRVSLVVGLGVFLAVAALPLFEGSRLLEYRTAEAAMVILVVESALTVSIAAILATAFIGAAPPRIRCMSPSRPAHSAEGERAGQS
jgi:multisubunit Na+/H+ antiporter MnhB subunit